MHAGRHFTLKEVLFWTRREIFVLLIVSTIPTVLYEVFDIKVVIPWLPLALIGTAVAFIVGFKNNATYGRLGEARTIWGAIINAFCCVKVEPQRRRDRKEIAKKI